MVAGVPALRLFLFGRVLTGIHFGLQYFFRAVGDGKTAIFNAALRKFVLLIPLALILPKLFGLGIQGVFFAESIADLCVAGSIISVYKMRSRKL